MKNVLRPFLLVVLSALILAACGGDGGVNLLVNPGFEDGNEPWHTMDSPSWSASFDMTSRAAHSGDRSVHLKLEALGAPALNRVYGVVQDVALTELPERLSGYYRVENWQKGTDFQYLQFVVVAFTADPQTGRTANTQIRYLLAGAASEPFEIGNAKFVFIDKAEPRQDAWVHFERNIREDFQQLWGSLPQGITSLRVFFEARFDSETAVQPQMAGDVYYDDLYLGE